MVVGNKRRLGMVVETSDGGNQSVIISPSSQAFVSVSLFSVENKEVVNVRERKREPLVVD